MSTRWFGVAVLTICTAAFAVHAWEQRDRRPNLLVILLDDWGIDRFDGFPGQPDTSARTPVLDALAADNVLFTSAFTDPECSPSRAALITGEFGVRTGVGCVFNFYGEVQHDFALEPSEHASLPAELGKLGYARNLVGKWHLTAQSFRPDPYAHAVAMGFERHVGVMANLNTLNGFSYRDYELVRADVDGVVREQVVDGTYITTRQVDDTLALIDSADERPWFTLLALSAPHKPWSRPPAHLIQGDPEALDLDDGPALYDAVLEATDSEIGRLLASIDPEVLANTVVFVLGDNGTPGEAFATREERSSKKGHPTDGGTHVPLIVAAPWLAAGTQPQLVHIVDLHATLLELAGGTALTEDSVSFASLLEREGRASTQASAPTRDWVYAARRTPIGRDGPTRQHSRMLRTRGWSLALRAMGDAEPSLDLRWHGDVDWGEGEAIDLDEVAAAQVCSKLLVRLADIERVPRGQAGWRAERAAGSTASTDSEEE